MCTDDGCDAGAIPLKMFSLLLPVELCTVAERDVPEVEPDIVAVERGGFGDQLNRKRLTIRKLNTKQKRPISHALFDPVSGIFDITGEHETNGAVSESI